MIDWREHIESRSDVLRGKACVKQTRLSVEHLVGLLAQGWTSEEVLDAYPGLTREQLLACLKYATESVANDQLFLTEA